MANTAGFNCFRKTSYPEIVASSLVAQVCQVSAACGDGQRGCQRSA